MQQKGLEMICYFDKFCTEHDLTYFFMWWMLYRNNSK